MSEKQDFHQILIS